jgi:hypothetical protein
MILVGGLAEPLHRRHSVLCHSPLASKESFTQFILGLGIAGCRFDAEIGQCLVVSLALLGVEAWNLRQLEITGALLSLGQLRPRQLALQ